MLGLNIQKKRPLKLLIVGAHADDIEIGCGGTVLRILREDPSVEVDWVVTSAPGIRKSEAQSSAEAFLGCSRNARIHIWQYQDGFLPYAGRDVKQSFESLKAECNPDLVFTHYREDRHQDHRLTSDLTWNTFRDSLVLEYEIPKWDGDIGQPNLYVTIERDLADRKVALLNEHFPSQHSRDWWDDETFLSIMRIRGIECRASSRFAEAFYARKLTLNPIAN
jgi:LmbE family N-acetylglucosaminyl deacetylase